MDLGAFTGGIERGGLTTDYEIRLLICYLLYKIDIPMTFDQLNSALQSEGLVNYFEFAEAVSLLIASGHIAAEERPDATRLFHLNDIGIRTAKTFEHSIPLSVREKALQSARRRLLQERIERENLVSYQKTQDGYQLTLCICDVGTDLLNLSVFVPTEERCLEIKKRFLSDPAAFYQGIVSLLMLEDLSDKEELPDGM